MDVYIMVRDAGLRAKKYDASLDPENIRARFESQKGAMSEQQKTYFAEIKLIEEKTKKIVEEAGVPTIEVAQYINVARKCYSIAKKFSGQTRTDEAQNVLNHWASRGLNGLLLARVCNLSGCGCSAGVPAGTPQTCAVGSVLICGPDGWQALTPGEACQYLHSRGPGLIPEWAGPPRIPRTLWAHAHIDEDAHFPAGGLATEGEMIIQIPHNWNGTDKVYIWLYAREPWTNVPMNIVGNAGTHGEALDNHTQTVNGTLLTIPIDTYYRWDVTAILNTLVPAIAPDDICWFVVGEDWGVAGNCMGVEIRET